MTTREGYCYQHVQAITVAIDAEKALGDREYFLAQRRRVGPADRSHFPKSDLLASPARSGHAHNPANLIDREAATDCGGAARASRGAGVVDWEQMKCVPFWPWAF